MLKSAVYDSIGAQVVGIKRGKNSIRVSISTNMASPAKKPKFNSKAKNYFIKQNQNSKKSYLKAGDQGYLVISFQLTII